MMFAELPPEVQQTIKAHDAVRSRFHDKSDEERFFTLVNRTAQELALFFANYDRASGKAHGL